MQMLMLMLSAVERWVEQLLYPPFLSTLRKRPDIHFVAAVQHYPDWPEYTLSDPARSRQTGQYMLVVVYANKMLNAIYTDLIFFYYSIGSTLLLQSFMEMPALVPQVEPMCNARRFLLDAL